MDAARPGAGWAIFTDTPAVLLNFCHGPTGGPQCRTQGVNEVTSRHRIATQAQHGLARYAGRMIASLGATFAFLLLCLGVVVWMFRTGYRLKN